MGNNSIRSNLSKEDIISDISLCIGADIYRENIYLLVEGEDDISLIHPYLSDNVLLYESYDGKNGVESIVNERFADNLRVIGIRDKDYQSEPSSNKIFFYDYGCMEMMLISNDEIFDNLCFEYYRGGRSSTILREEILVQLKYLSIIRMLNEKESWGITIKGISINNAWNSSEEKIDNDVIISRLIAINPNGIAQDKLRRVEQDYVVEWSKNDYFNNTQGHDFSTLFATICNQYKKKGIKYTEVEASARCIFRWSDFARTNLCHKINEYSVANSLDIMRYRSV